MQKRFCTQKSLMPQFVHFHKFNTVTANSNTNTHWSFSVRTLTLLGNEKTRLI